MVPTATKLVCRRSSIKNHHVIRLMMSDSLVDDAEYLVNVLNENGSRFQMVSHVDRDITEVYFKK